MASLTGPTYPGPDAANGNLPGSQRSYGRRGPDKSAGPGAPCHAGGMAGDDDIEKLLREIDASNAGGSSSGAVTPAPKSSPPATTDSGDSPFVAGLKAGLIGGAVSAALVFVIFLILPFIGASWQSTLGAFVAGFLNALYFRYRGKKG